MLNHPAQVIARRLTKKPFLKRFLPIISHYEEKLKFLSAPHDDYRDTSPRSLVVFGGNLVQSLSVQPMPSFSICLYEVAIFALWRLRLVVNTTRAVSANGGQKVGIVVFGT